MDLSTARWLLASAGGAFLLLASAPALAQPEVPDACRQECREARGACQIASHAAYRTCRAACQDGDVACLRSCASALEGAAVVCRDELVECGVACGHELDPVCAATCREDLGDCREEISLCAGDCRQQTLAALQQCRQQAADAAGAGTLACVRAAFAAGEQCRKDCRVELRCGPGFRECLGACVVPE